MKIDIVSENMVRRMIKEELNKKVSYLEKEIDKLRERMIDLEIIIENMGKR